MLNPPSEIEQVQQNISDSRKVMEQRDKAVRLIANPDFRALFVEGYFVTEAARLIQLSGDTNLNAEIRADCVQAAQATGYAKRFLTAIITQGNIAENSLVDSESVLEELRSEDAE